MMQQMEVTVPAGIGPGMPFIVNTPTGQMQVTCPQGATAGGQMLVSVPTAAPVAVKPVVVLAEPTAGADQPVVVTGTVVPEQVFQPTQTVPMQQSMQRASPMANREQELKDGCYYQQNAPCCFLMQLKFDNAEKTQLSMGPGCFCCCVVGCCPGCCGVYNYDYPDSQSGVYKEARGKKEYITWQTENSFTINGGVDRHVSC